MFKSPEAKEIPNIVLEAVEKINSNLLYSIDIVKSKKGLWIVVEIGDGQVSGLKEWSVDEFYSVFNYSAQNKKKQIKQKNFQI